MIDTKDRAAPRGNRALRRSLEAWQRAGIGLFALATVCSAAQSAVFQHRQHQWEADISRAEAQRAEAVAELAAVSLASVREAQARTAQAEAYEALGDWTYIGECRITAYCCEAYPHICGTGDGITASGIPVAPGIVAVDPEVIPLGSTLVIDGQRYLAADTGSGVRGQAVDIAVTTHQEAVDFGVRTAKVWVVAS